jgi:hypothetical protein
MRVAKTVYPPMRFDSFNEWSIWFFGLCKKGLESKKLGWDKNIYIPKKK